MGPRKKRKAEEEDGSVYEGYCPNWDRRWLFEEDLWIFEKGTRDIEFQCYDEIDKIRKRELHRLKHRKHYEADLSTTATSRLTEAAPQEQVDGEWNEIRVSPSRANEIPVLTNGDLTEEVRPTPSNEVKDEMRDTNKKEGQQESKEREQEEKRREDEPAVKKERAEHFEMARAHVTMRQQREPVKREQGQELQAELAKLRRGKEIEQQTPKETMIKSEPLPGTGNRSGVPAIHPAPQAQAPAVHTEIHSLDERSSEVPRTEVRQGTQTETQKELPLEKPQRVCEEEERARAKDALQQKVLERRKASPACTEASIEECKPQAMSSFLSIVGKSQSSEKEKQKEIHERELKARIEKERLEKEEMHRNFAHSEARKMQRKAERERMETEKRERREQRKQRREERERAEKKGIPPEEEQRGSECTQVGPMAETSENERRREKKMAKAREKAIKAEKEKVKAEQMELVHLQIMESRRANPRIPRRRSQPRQRSSSRHRSHRNSGKHRSSGRHRSSSRRRSFSRRRSSSRQRSSSSSRSSSRRRSSSTRRKDRSRSPLTHHKSPKTETPQNRSPSKQQSPPRQCPLSPLKKQTPPGNIETKLDSGKELTEHEHLDKS